MSDDTLRASAKFRAIGRVPAFCWRHPRNGASLARCSQPYVGFLKTSRSPEDEQLVQAIRGRTRKPLYLLDSRPSTYAKANKLMGRGHETTDVYQDCRLVFLGIGNIHDVVDSYTKLLDLCHFYQEGT